MRHNPDGWTLLEFTESGKPTFYKIFATWRWQSDRWRLSSGLYDLSTTRDCGTHLEWKQESGSIYHLPMDGENCHTMYQGLVMNKIISDSNKLDVSVSVRKLKELFNCSASDPTLQALSNRG